MPASPYLEDLLLRYMVRGETFVIDGWWLGLNSTTTALSSNESDMGRVFVVWDATYLNQDTLTWLQAPGTFVVRSLVLFDAETGGNFLGYGAVSPQVNVAAGATPQAAAGTVGLDILNS